MKISFSVIITTYNRNRLLKRSIKSVLSQSLQPKEIIIINNYFKDIKIAFKSNKIKIHKSEYTSDVANGRNLGAKLAKGNYLAYLDDDDYWHKNYLKISKKNIMNNLTDILIAKDIALNKKKTQIFKTINKFNMHECFVKNPGIIGSNIIIKKKCFKKINGFDKDLIPSEDKSLTIDAYLLGKKINIQNNYIIYNNTNKNKLSSNFKKLKHGKFNFIKKYRKYMSIRSILFNYKSLIIYIIKSYLKN